MKADVEHVDMATLRINLIRRISKRRAAICETLFVEINQCDLINIRRLILLSV